MNFSLCVNFSPKFEWFKDAFKSKKKGLVEAVTNDLVSLIKDKNVDNVYIDSHILNKLIQITGSEYGFIGYIEGDKLQMTCITNIAWNESSFEFFSTNINSNLEFPITRRVFFGQSILDKVPIIVNKYNESRRILPPGHPIIKRFIGYPVTSCDCVKYFVGLCNKFEKYKQSDISMVRQIMGVHSLTSIIDLKRDRFSSVRNTRRQSREFSSGNSSDNRESDSRDSRSRSRSGGSRSGSGSSGGSRETSDKSKTSSSQVYEFLMQ
jgi:uncharacterized membrane protein YgcG